MEVYTVEYRLATEFYETETGEFLGELASSVGEHGTSTGIFRRCVTTNPVAELGLIVVQEF